MIEGIILLIVLIALLLVLWDDHRPVRWTRGTQHPWILYGSDGSVKVDFTHPEMRKRIREACEAVEKMRK